MGAMTRKAAPAVLVFAMLAVGIRVPVTAASTGAPRGQAAQQSPAPAAVSKSGVQPPAGYVIGADDVLSVLFRYDKDLTTDVVVRPDGMITLPILNDIHAAGLTPDQLRDAVSQRATRFIADPAVTVIVKQINSRKVFITGEVNRPGAYHLGERMTVLQLIAVAGGLTEYAKAKDIVVMRGDSGGTVRPAGQPVSYRFNYREVMSRKKLEQNIELKPGDTVIVP